MIGSHSTPFNFPRRDSGSTNPVRLKPAVRSHSSEYTLFDHTMIRGLIRRERLSFRQASLAIVSIRSSSLVEVLDRDPGTGISINIYRKRYSLLLFPGSTECFVPTATSVL